MIHFLFSLVRSFNLPDPLPNSNAANSNSGKKPESWQGKISAQSWYNCNHAVSGSDHIGKYQQIISRSQFKECSLLYHVSKVVLVIGSCEYNKKTSLIGDYVLYAC
jgi:hypothetical protein